jgi:hypothetical protein
MALDPRLSLAGTVTDVGTAVSQGLASRDKARTQGVRERLLKQQEQMGAQEVASMQGQYMNQLASNLMGKPMDQRAALVAQQLPFLSQMGINPQQIIGADLSDQGLQSVVTQTHRSCKAAKALAPTNLVPHKQSKMIRVTYLVQLK